MRLWAAVLFLSVFPFPGVAEECATALPELAKTERLSRLTEVLREGHPAGFVNVTKGSYFIITTRDGKFIITFFTSGLFDLYPIKREGPLSFCDDGTRLTVVGLGRKDELHLQGAQLVLGDGGPKKQFQAGPMPARLMELHRIPQRGLASD